MLFKDFLLDLEAKQNILAFLSQKEQQTQKFT